MAKLVLTAPRPLSGKTTVAAALAAHARSQGVSFALERAGDDENASADSAFFAALSESTDDAQLSLGEAPAGEASVQADVKVVVVASGDTPASEVVEFSKAGGADVAGVVLNRIPEKRRSKIEAEYAAAGLHALVVIPEDRTLGAPLLRDLVEALDAEASHVNNGRGALSIDKPIIASISSDPGETSFTRQDPSVVIVRSDKPDLQLSAINAGARSLILTGNLPILSYVLERAQEDEIPLLRTQLGTVKTVEAIEQLFGAKPFSGGDSKMARLAELCDGSALLALASA
ncbi:MAG: hypothetical protein IH957_09755 [Chloroflexi bacterium]|nr:hypothetical protein [Chloroflexota bacterium]